MKIAIVVSLFNASVTEKMLEQCLLGLSDAGLKQKDSEVFFAPGAFEIPALAEKIIRTRKFDGIIALGAVIKGETDHYDYICRAVAYGIQKVASENAFPVLFGILTCKTAEQAVTRINRGYDYGKNIVDLIKQYQLL